MVMINVRVRIDGVDSETGLPVHMITNLNGLLSLVGYPMQKRMVYAFQNCKRKSYKKKLRRGLKIEIFEY